MTVPIDTRSARYFVTHMIFTYHNLNRKHPVAEMFVCQRHYVGCGRIADLWMVIVSESHSDVTIANYNNKKCSTKNSSLPSSTYPYGCCHGCDGHAALVNYRYVDERPFVYPVYSQDYSYWKH